MYYVAGNTFVTGYIDTQSIQEFHLIRPSKIEGDEPCYITKNFDGLKTTSHHASLYEVKETDIGYILTRVQHRCISPRQITLHKFSKLWNYLQRSIQYAEANNKFYD